MKGILLTTNNRMKVKEYADPVYQSVREDLGGWMELVHPIGLPESYLMLVNEEGILLGLERNDVASLLYGFALHGNEIRGNVIFLKEEITPEGPDIGGLDKADIKVLRGLLIRIGVDEDE